MSCEKDTTTTEISNSNGELFNYEWRIDNLGELENASAAFYKTITISSVNTIQIKVKRSPVQIHYLPDYLHEAKIRIRDISLEAIVSCNSSVYKMTNCSVLLHSLVDDLSDGDVVVNNIFGESEEQTKVNEHLTVYKHTDVMTYECPKPNDLLTLVCKIQIIFSSQDISVNSNPRINFGRLFDNNQFTDFIFTVSGVEFHIHKAILALYSPVFEDIFENDLLAEKKDNRAVINDFNPKVFKEVLRFIYTGEIENFYEIALELLKIADKYEIKALKTVCEQRMCVHLLDLPVEDAIVLLACADMYRCEWLKSRIIEFIVSRPNSIVTTVAWKEFILKNPKLTNEVRDAMIRARVPLCF